MENNFSRGSEWRRWDLHLHTASSYDYEYKSEDSDEKIVEMLQKEEIAAVAITDHFLIDSERIKRLRELGPEITFFPGVELRTDKGSKSGNLHLIIIFSDEMDVDTLQADFDSIMLRKNAKDLENDEKIHWNFEDIIEFAKDKDGLITIHAGNKDRGIDDEISNTVPINQAIKHDIAKSVDFFEVGRKNDINDYNDIVFKQIDRKPILICSDNHNPNDYSVKERLWIKANPTFEGLKQCIYQPEERIFIGDTPPIIERVNNKKQLIIDNIEIKKTDDANNVDKKWFDTSLQFNPGLVSIIGNKGSGKSAVSDILGHITGASTMSHASFLSSNRFKKKPTDYADDYVVNLEWLDGKINTDILSSNIDESSIEYSQYLPQQYIEDLCNDLGDSFQNEIDKVIFSYVDESERGDSLNLEDLVNYRSRSVQLQITRLKEELSSINNEIIKIKYKSTGSYKDSIIKGLETVDEALKRHETNKPKEVEKPRDDSDDAYQETLQSLNDEISKLNVIISEKNEEQKKINNKITDFNTLQTQINILLERSTDVNTEIEKLNEKYQLKDLQAINVTTPLDIIEEYIIRLTSERNKIKDTILNLDSQSEESLVYQLSLVEKSKRELIASADGEEKAYQKYISDLARWHNTRKQMIGDSTTDETKIYYEKELVYLTNEIKQEHEQLKTHRQGISQQIFIQKGKLGSVFTEIYNPIENIISELVSKMDEKISFEVELKLKNHNLAEHLLKHINQRYAGIFKGKTESNIKMNSLIGETDFSDWKSIETYINRVINVVYEDLDNSNRKVIDKKVFYKELFELDYIDISFQLKMGDRSLTELSPGERGIVLLTFFLALSKESKPIIIDQPEDNLDNQSVYKKLVPCINEAKKKRQVFIVTHNPNIAIACDSDQIIYADMNKDSYEITYESGAIEDQKINEYIIDILEGTEPAFDLRRRKYKF